MTVFWWGLISFVVGFGTGGYAVKELFIKEMNRQIEAKRLHILQDGVKVEADE